MASTQESPLVPSAKIRLFGFDRQHVLWSHQESLL